ncbi:MAG: PAS domain S-box protein [Candidatus Neomarinimicrobiota bacterium]
MSAQIDFLLVLLGTIVIVATVITLAIHMVISSKRDLADRMQAEEDAERHSEELAALNAIAVVVSQSLDLDEILNTALDKVLELMNLDVGGIYLADPVRHELDLAVHRGISEEFADEVKSVSVDEKTLEAVMAEGKLRKFILSVEAVIKDRVELKRILSAMKKEGLSPTATVPVLLQAKEEILGLMTVASRVPRQFSEAEFKLLTSIGRQIAVAIENARLYEKEKRKANQLALISEVGKKAVSILNLDKLLQEATRSIQEKFNYYNVSLCLLNEDHNELVMPAIAGGFEHMAPGQYRQSLNEGIMGFVARTGQPWLANDISEDPYYVKGFLGEVLTKSELCVPIKLGAKMLGVLDMQSIHINDFAPGDVLAMEAMADQIAIAIENARLYRAAQEVISERKRAEEALRVSELRYRSLVDNAGAGIATADIKGRLTYVNQALCKIMGYSEKELIGKPFADFLHPDDKRHILKIFWNAWKEPGREIELEFRVIHKNGSVVHMHSRPTVTFFKEEIIGFNAIIVDITELKRVEEEIRQRNEDLTFINELNNAINRGKSLQEVIELLARETRDIFSSYGAAVYLLSEDSQHLIMQNLPLTQKTVNQIEKLIDRKIPTIKVPLKAGSLSSEWLHSSKPKILKDPEEIRDWVWEFADKSNLNGKPLPRPLQKIIPQIKRLLGIKSILVVPLASKGNVFGLLHIAGREPFTESDLTRFEILSGPLTAMIVRKRVEEELRASELKFRLLFHQVPMGVFQSTPSGRLLTVNPALMKMLGYDTEEEMSDLDIARDLYANPEDRKFVTRELEKTGELRNIELLLKRRDGTDITALENAYTVRDAQGKVKYYEGTLTDITELKRAEDQLRESREQLRSLSAHLQSVREDERTQIAREIHDELGQELTALKMDLSWLKSKLRKDQQPLEEKANAMGELSNSMIQTVKRITSELRPAILDDLGVAAAIDWELGEFHKRTGIKCDLKLEPEDIVLDPDRSTAVYRIFQETLTNVSRHAQASTVTVTLRLRRKKLNLEIGDDGVGISEEQITNSRSLGLIGMHERAVQFGGEVRIEGREGQGTTVSVTIPLDNGENRHD